MSRGHARTVLILVGGLAAGSCGDNGGQEPVRPQLLAIESGNNQTGQRGAALPLPLTVLVTGTDGRPFAGGTVHWGILSGNAQIAPATSTTDANGIAIATLTLGNATGAVVASADMDGLTAVSFNATSVLPCDLLVPYTLGTTVTGSLTVGDCPAEDGSFFDRYGLHLDQAQSIRFTQRSSAFNSFLLLRTPAGNTVAFHDDISATDRNASMRVFMAPGDYVISPSGLTPADLGAYTLETAVSTAPVTGCEFTANWATRGVQITDALTATDCELGDEAGNLYYADPYLIFLQQGTTVTFRQTSTVVDTYLELYRVGALGVDFIGFNDDDEANPPTTDSRLTHNVVVSGIYLLLPSSAAPQEVGAYTLVIQ